MKIDAALVARLLEGAKKRGADLAEVYIKTSKTLSAEARDRELDAAESSASFGYSLRVIRDQRLGFAYSTDRDAADTVIDCAIGASRWTEKDDSLGLPGPLPCQPMDILDRAVSSVSEEDAVARALTIERSALETDSRVKKVRKASASFSQKHVLIMNTEGVDVGYASTACSAQITVVAEGGGDSQMGWDFYGGRFLEDVAFEEVGRNAAKRALLLLGARTMNAVKTDVMLDHSVAVDFLGIFATLLSSEYVQKGKSLLAKKIHQEVVSSLISIVDDGSAGHRLGSRPVDDEGVPTSRKYLIENGVLKGYLYNTSTARKEGVDSSGNAVRAGFSSLPGVGPLNLSITASPEAVQSGDLILFLDKGLFITEVMGIHTANPISGEFSIGVSGAWVENGTIRYPVKEAVISGNILDLFTSIKAVGNDFRFYGTMGSPSLLLGPVDISA
jgi:PmbA protein